MTLTKKTASTVLTALALSAAVTGTAVPARAVTGSWAAGPVNAKAGRTLWCLTGKQSGAESPSLVPLPHQEGTVTVARCTGAPGQVWYLALSDGWLVIAWGGNKKADLCLGYKPGSTQAVLSPCSVNVSAGTIFHYTPMPGDPAQPKGSPCRITLPEESRNGAPLAGELAQDAPATWGGPGTTTWSAPWWHLGS